MTKQESVKNEKTSERSYQCCGNTQSKTTENSEVKETIEDKERIRRNVRKQYADFAKGNLSSDLKTVSEDLEPPEKQIGDTLYSEEDLKSIPKGANMDLGSGNPVGLASIQPGEIVVDLGSGAGIDCFLAANKTGKNGKVIGVDMTSEMIDKARANAREYENVEFRLGEIEHMPIADNTADLIISNCVINLSVDKSQVFKDAYRILKPGGRLMISDIVLENELPGVVQEALKGTSSCVSRSLLKTEYLEVIRTAGFEDVEIVDQMMITPRKKALEEEGGKRKAQMYVDGQKVEVELSEEEAERLAKSISTAHIKAIKPKIPN